MTQLTRLRGWHRAISGIRPRILVWYFLLTTSAVLMSIGVTRQMYCDRLKAKAQDSLVQEVQRFRLLANQQRQDAVQSSENVAALFDRFLASYMPTRNEYIITLLNDQIYKSSPTVPKNLLDKHPSLMREWTKTAQPLQGELDTTEARIVYVAEPVRIGSNASETPSQNASGLIVAIHDSTADYQAGTSAIALVIK